MRRNVVCGEYAGGVENQEELRDSNKDLRRSLDRLTEGPGGKTGDIKACPFDPLLQFQPRTCIDAGTVNHQLGQGHDDAVSDGLCRLRPSLS